MLLRFCGGDRFKIGDLNVSFPYEAMYKEQLEYMTELKKLLDSHVSLLALRDIPTSYS